MLILHGAPVSTCTARVLVSLLAMGLETEKDFQIAPASLADIRTPEWLTHQPFGQMPWLEDTETEVEVCESRAIIRYVGAKIRSSLVPSDDLATFAKYEQGAQHELTQWAPCTDRLAMELVFVKRRGGETNQEVVVEQKEVLQKKLEGYERILSKQGYIGGDKMTLVDLAHLPYGNIVDYMGAAPGLTDGSLPNVTRWWKELLALPAWSKTKEMGHTEYRHLRK